MSTTSITLTLPDSLRHFVEERVIREGHGSPADFIESLLREEQKKEGEKKLEMLILAGLDSGAASPMIPEDWAAIREEGLRQLGVSPPP